MANQSSQAYQIHLNDKSGDLTSPSILNNLVLKSVPIPTPGEGEVLIRLHAASLNYRDLLILSNSPIYPVPTEDGLVPLADGSGVVEATGPNSVWASRIGEGVLLTICSTWLDGSFPAEGINVSDSLGCGSLDGTLRQYAVVKDDALVLKPNNLSFEEAAAMVTCGGTAMNILQGLESHHTILTQGTGGVSCFTIAYAAAMGARVISTSSSEEKLKIAKSLGATDLMNYRTTPSWENEVLKITDGKGVNLVADVTGSVEQSLKATGSNGKVAVVGYLDVGKKEIERVDLLIRLMLGSKSLTGVLGNSKAMLEQAVTLTEKHNLHPIIKTFDWIDAKEAYEELMKQEFVGKIVIKIAG